MAVDSLDDLALAFRSWRSKKRYPREGVPDDLMERARGAIAVHGAGAVAAATGFKSGRFLGDIESREKSAKAAVVSKVPAFSRLDVAGPMSQARPIIVADTPSGVKLSVFQMTPETLDLLAGIFGTGGAR
jgi:hypothetical protein